MKYSVIREMDVSNGEGIGISLFVQGCHFHCKGCFNPETWDFNGGKEWTNDIETKFLQLADKPYVKRISILGGEPLADENVETVYSLLNTIRTKFKASKKIWLYTGYKWEDINFFINYEIGKIRFNTVKLADVIVDGQFDLKNQDLYNKEIIFAGSTNQRVIDTQKSIMQNKIVLYKGI